MSGSGMVYLSDVFPEAKRIGLLMVYKSTDADVDFLCQGPVDRDRALRLGTWNIRLY